MAPSVLGNEGVEFTAESWWVYALAIAALSSLNFGSRWFRYLCEQRGIDPVQTFEELVAQYMKGGVRGPFNTVDRQRAGFSREEMAALERMDRQQRRGSSDQ